MKITIAHSPDSDDAFMFYALAKNKIDTGSYQFEHVLTDIQTLSHKAIHTQEYDLSAISYHAFSYAAAHYVLMESGSSMGDNYGPTLIAAKEADPKSVLNKIKMGEITVAVPGLLTSAYLALKLFVPNVKVQEIPFDQIQDWIKENPLSAGLIIHEGQLNFERNGFIKLVNFGEWWFERTGGLPLPLGANVLRRNLPENVKKDLSLILKRAIEYSLQHREEALDYALTFGRGLEKNEADRFVGMYVNELTLGLGSRGKKSVELFLREAYQVGLIPHLPQLEFV